MALRSISATALLALALTACSGEPPAAEETPAAAAPEAAASAAPEAAPTAEPTAAETPAAETSPAAEAAKVSAVTAPAAGKPATPEVVKVAAVVAPPAAFGRCAVCHTAEKGGEDKLGPKLPRHQGRGQAAGNHRLPQAAELTRGSQGGAGRGGGSDLPPRPARFRPCGRCSAEYW